jgi:serine/threonine-protein kinase
MGANDDEPIREVTVAAFRIARYPVTVLEYIAFIETGGYEQQQHWAAGGFDKFEQPGRWEEQLLHPNWPVTDVSWFEAAAYAAWAGCRLLTEAEWEYAARGTTGRKYPWGNEPPTPDLLNFDGNVGHPTPVGVYPRGATPEGICDMAGNVWEWCADWYDDTQATSRVYRGGGWFSSARNCQSAYRDIDSPGSSRSGNLGFRLAPVR